MLVSHIEAHAKGLFSAHSQTIIKLLTKPKPSILPILLPGSIVVPDMVTHKWVPSKTLYVYEAEATAPHTILVTSDKIQPICLMVREDTSHIRHGLHAPSILTTWNLCHLSELLVMHHTVDTFSSYGIAISVQSASSKHKSMVHEINLSHVFCFLDHFLPDNVVSYSKSVTQQWAVSQGIQWTFPTPSHPQPSGRTELWNNLLKNCLPSSPASGSQNQFYHWMQLSPKRNNLISATSW